MTRQMQEWLRIAKDDEQRFAHLLNQPAPNVEQNDNDCCQIFAKNQALTEGQR
jgi:hypothetical protein